MNTKRVVFDSLNRKIELSVNPERIISLSPSISEYVFDAGGGELLVGRTRYCKYPVSHIKKVPCIGGTKSIDLDRVRLLNPDLIIASEEDNDMETLNLLAETYPVYITRVRNLNEAMENMWHLGELINREKQTLDLITKIKNQFADLKPLEKRKRVMYIMWTNPLITVNENTLIHDVLDRCGFENVTSCFDDKYPRIDIETIEDLKPDVLLMSDDPYPFNKDHVEEMQRRFPKMKIELVNGEVFSWHESHLSKTCDYLSPFLSKLSNVAVNY